MSDWLVVGEWTNTSYWNKGGYTYRQVIPASAVPSSCTKVRVTFQADRRGSCAYHAMIGRGTGVGAKLRENPTVITVDGSDPSYAFTVPAGQKALSDEIAFSYSPSDGYPLIVHFWIFAAAIPEFDNPSHSVGRGGVSYSEVYQSVNPGFMSPAQAGDAASTDYAKMASFDVLGVAKIEFFNESGDVVSLVFLGSSFRLAPASTNHEVSKLSMYAIEQPLGVALSKVSLYGVVDSAISKSMGSDYGFIGAPVEVSLSSSYAFEIGPVLKVLNSDYRFVGPFVKSLDSDFQVLGLFTLNTLDSDYRIAGGIFETTFSSEYRILQDNGFFADRSFSYEIDRQPPISLPKIQLYPIEPTREGWAWLTRVNIAYSGKEQRISMRHRPRIMINYQVALPDERDRLNAYRQLYNSIGKQPLIPFFHYATRLTGDTLPGSNELTFNREKTYIQKGDYLCLYRSVSQQYSFSVVTDLTSTGAVIDQTFGFPLGEDWEVMPALQMRLPNLSAISMEALTGEYTLSGEQTVARDFIRQGDDTVLQTFDGYPILDARPVAVSSINERFDTNAEVIDNDTGLPKPYSSYENPFIDGTSEWYVDRDRDMDFWRKFLYEVRGRQGSFLFPTWREDLTVLEEGFDYIIVEEVDYAEKFQHRTYQCLQLESPVMVDHYVVKSVQLETPTTLRVTFDRELQSSDIFTVSFLNLVRLNEDVIYFDHYRNYSTVALPIRTINE